MRVVPSMIVELDFETRSECDLLRSGAWAYSEHPSTEIICVCWAIDDGPVRRWWPDWLRASGECDDPQEIFDAVASGALVEAFSAAFEYSIWQNVARRLHDWPELPLEQVRDLMAVACYYALPAKLAKLLEVLGLPGKDPAGDRLISKYSKLHLKTAARLIPTVDADRFVDYCEQDVDQEREAGKILGDLPEDEERVFLHDFAVGARGIYLDAHGIGLASRVVDMRSEELAREFRKITGLNPGQRDAIIQWARGHGVELANLQAEYLEGLLEITEEDLAPWNDDLANPVQVLDGVVADALRLRLQHSRSSTSKLDAMERQRGRDGRARFQAKYHGAVTGRNTGTGFQPLNLTRGWDWVSPPDLVRDISYMNSAYLDAVYGDAMKAVAAASRHWIKAERGKRLIAGDFSSIEAVVTACLAGEEWKIQLFRDKGDPYVAFASKALGREVRGKKDPDVTTQDLEDRQNVGKRGELAFGYQGAVGAWRKFDTSGTFDDDEIVVFVKVWREQHQMVVALWYGLQRAAIAAVLNPEDGPYFYRDIGFERVDGWLTMILPDGKRLWYWSPRIRYRMPRWHKPDEREDCAVGTCDCREEPALSYMSWKGGRWIPVDTYGGKLTENAVQATSRQILKHCELLCDERGYDVILSVYDEIVAEVPLGWGSAEEFEEIMTNVPDFAQRWPIRAECWEAERYHK